MTCISCIVLGKKMVPCEREREKKTFEAAFVCSSIPSLSVCTALQIETVTAALDTYRKPRSRTWNGNPWRKTREYAKLPIWQCKKHYIVFRFTSALHNSRILLSLIYFHFIYLFHFKQRKKACTIIVYHGSQRINDIGLY